MARSCVSVAALREVAAEGVDRHRIGAVQAAHEVGDRIRGVDEAAVHVVAGVEQDEHVGADQRVRRPLRARARPAASSVGARWAACRRRAST